MFCSCRWRNFRGLLRIYDGEFFKDCTVIVFKHKGELKYDVYVDSIVECPKVPKVTYITDLKSYLKENSQLIGFNNQSFDNQVLQKILKENIKGEEVYSYSQNIIKSKDKKREFQDKRLSFSYLDLYKINHYDNPARATSLKKLEFNYRRKKIADLPFHHSETTNTVAKLEMIIRYCIEDTNVTEECYEKTLEAIKLRQSLTEIYSKEFQGFNCMNLSDSAIGEELNLLYYCKETGLDYYEVKYNVPKYPDLVIEFKDCIPEIVEFKTPELQELLIELKNTKVSGTKEFKKKINFRGLIISLGQGGLHSEDPPRIIRQSDDEKLIDADITGQYPLEIIKRKLFPRHLSKEWVINAEKRYKERAALKPFIKTDNTIKAKSDALKIQLNASLYGKTNSEFSWQYDPLVTMKTTLGCQTTMLMLVEELMINKFTVVSINTDGIVTLVDKTKEHEFYSILNSWSKKVGNDDLGGFEYTEYEFIAQTSVNDYIAKSVTGEVKCKGDFLTYKDFQKGMWHKDSSARIIPLALENYFIHNTPVEETVNSCKSLYEFCYGVKKQKAPKKGEFKWLISEIKNKLVKNSLSEDRFIRYYIGGTTTVNKLYDDGEIKNLSTKENPVTICQYIRKDGIPENLDLNFYINEAKELICTMEELEKEN